MTPHPQASELAEQPERVAGGLLPLRNLRQDPAQRLTLPTGLTPISLEELTLRAALLTRVDRKYLLPRAQAQQVLLQLPGSTRVLHVGDSPRSAYDSVYFDTPELLCFHAAAHGRRHRAKIRTRSYLDSGTAFLEVKTEGARETTVKERIPYPPEHRTRLTSAGSAYVTEALQHIPARKRLDQRSLRAVLSSSYERTTLFLPDSGARATIDEIVTWQTPKAGARTLDDHVVIETKSGSSAGELDRLLWRHGIRPTNLSKYATGMAALTPELPHNKWARTLRQRLPLRPAFPHTGKTHS